MENGGAISRKAENCTTIFNVCGPSPMARM